jgi:hypothetical protein
MTFDFCSAYTSYNPTLPFSMKFPGPSFCDGKQKLMVVAMMPPTVKKVIFLLLECPWFCSQEFLDCHFLS